MSGVVLAPMVDVDLALSERVQAAMARSDVSVDMLAIVLGIEFPEALSKLAGCGDGAANDVHRASLPLGVPGVSPLPCAQTTERAPIRGAGCGDARAGA